MIEKGAWALQGNDLGSGFAGGLSVGVWLQTGLRQLGALEYIGCVFSFGRVPGDTIMT